jgi:hypothetical protein
LIARATLLDMEKQENRLENGTGSTFQAQATAMPPRARRPIPTYFTATFPICRVKRDGQLSLGESFLERNNLIKSKYAQGNTLSQLAILFGISVQRVHQIIHGIHQ